MSNYLSFTHHTVAWLKKAADEGTLNMRPPFQRNPVWLPPQKAYLIDTLLRGYPVPELYMQDLVDEQGNEQHTVVDGQQRIRACLEFIEGEFALNPEDSPEYGDSYFEDLPGPAKKLIYEYKFVVRVLPEAPEEELRAIFSRLNRNVVALNKQELRNATYWGPFIRLMESLAGDPFWGKSGLFTTHDVRRMLDIEYVSELSIGLLHGPQNKKDTLDTWYATYEENFEEGLRLEELFRNAIGEIEQILPDISSTRWSKKSDFYSVLLVFGNHAMSLPVSRDSRNEARERLLSFGGQVDATLARAAQLVAQATASALGEGEEEPAEPPSPLTSTERMDEADVPTDTPSDEPPSPDVELYSAAVGRAASDRVNRRTRGEVLERLLAGIWE